jgi:hypothetical protein
MTGKVVGVVCALSFRKSCSRIVFETTAQAIEKSAYDGRRYSFVGMRSLCGEAICTQLVILQPRRHDRTSGAHHQLISTPANLLIILSASPSPYQKTPCPYNQSPSPARRKCRLAGQRRQAFHSSRFHYWESCTLVAPSGCRS